MYFGKILDLFDVSPSLENFEMVMLRHNRHWQPKYTWSNGTELRALESYSIKFELPTTMNFIFTRVVVGEDINIAI